MKRSTVNVSVTLSMNTTCIMGTFIVNNDAFIMLYDFFLNMYDVF